MKIHEMTKEDFSKVPIRRNFMAPVPMFKSLVIIPTDQEHDSGYLCMEFVAVNKDDEPIVRMSGCSDVLDINGIGGYGNWRLCSGIPKTIPPISWRIDCLPKSGYLRLFCDHFLTCGDSLSNFEVYASEVEK